jgi:hypothetical protein
VERKHSLAAKDYSKPFEDEPVKPEIQIGFRGSEESVMGGVGDLGLLCEVGDLESEGGLDTESMIGEVSDLELEENLDSVTESESESEVVSRRRTEASDSDDSDDSEVDKMSAQGSEPDSGIGTGSNARSGSDIGTVSSSSSECKLLHHFHGCMHVDKIVHVSATYSIQTCYY